jgi:hypothetical protein
MVQTGGRSRFAVESPIRGSKKRIHNRFGVLRMVLPESAVEQKYLSVCPAASLGRGQLLRASNNVVDDREDAAPFGLF